MRKQYNRRSSIVLAIAASLLFFLLSGSVSANTLKVDEDASVVLHVGAAILLYAHIGGGAIGLLSGTLASLSVKGSAIHRLSGKVFVVSMLVCYLIGALVSPFLDSQQSTNFVAAILALYLLMTGVGAARRRNFTSQASEKIGFFVSLFITILGASFMYLASQSVDGSIDGSPPQAYILFVVAGGLACIGDLTVIVHKKLSQTIRVARHLWRMSMSFFIASGSLFFGQEQFFPEWFVDSFYRVAFGLFPLIILIIYLVKIGVNALVKRNQVASSR